MNGLPLWFEVLLAAFMLSAIGFIAAMTVFVWSQR